MTDERKINFHTSPREQAAVEHLKTEIDRGIKFLNGGQYDRSILVFRQLLPKVQISSAFFDILQHNLLTAYKRRIEQILDLEDVTPVNRYLPEVFKLTLKGDLSTDPRFRGGFADVFKQLGTVFYEKRQHEAALACFRKAIEIQPCPSYYVDLTNALAFTKERARLKDYTLKYPTSDLGRHIFIACTPKSGSTFLKNVLVGVTGYRDLFTVYAALQNEQELYMPQLAKFGNVDTVTQQHVRASEANIQLMQAFGIKPVVLVRNIYDTVASLLDFYRLGFTFSTFFDREDFLTFDEEHQIDLLIQYAIPWHFQFVASWQRAEKDNRLDVRWLTYENLMKDKVETIEQILGYYQVSADPLEIAKQISTVESNREQNRINIGISGRGDSILSPSQKNRIKALGRHFTRADLSCLGL